MRIGQLFVVTKSPGCSGGWRRNCFPRAVPILSDRLRRPVRPMLYLCTGKRPDLPLRCSPGSIVCEDRYAEPREPRQVDVPAEAPSSVGPETTLGAHVAIRVLANRFQRQSRRSDPVTTGAKVPRGGRARRSLSWGTPGPQPPAPARLVSRVSSVGAHQSRDPRSEPRPPIRAATVWERPIEPRPCEEPVLRGLRGVAESRRGRLRPIEPRPVRERRLALGGRSLTVAALITRKLKREGALPADRAKHAQDRRQVADVHVAVAVQVSLLIGGAL